MNVSAVIPTRGNVDLAPVVESIRQAGVSDIVVWDNSVRGDLSVYARYAAIHEAEHYHIYTQDDDCLIDVAKILAAYQPGRLVANMPKGRWPDYPDSALVGWGSVFDRDLPDLAMGRFAEGYGVYPVLDAIEQDRGFFLRTCDVVFSSLTPRTVIDIGFEHRDFAEGPDRMFKQPGHKQERDRMLEMCRQIRGSDDVRWAV